MSKVLIHRIHVARTLNSRSVQRVREFELSSHRVTDLTWIQVCSAEEAWRILRAGRRNLSFASTHLNQNCSRR